MFGWDTYMPTLFKLLLPKIRYMGDEKCRIHLDAMREIYIMTVLNLKIVGDKCPPPLRNPHETDFKVGDMVLLKNHTLTKGFDVKYKTSYRICKWLLDKAFDIQDNTGKVRCVSIQHLQLLHSTDQLLTLLPDMTSFGQITKYSNHPNLMTNLHATERKDKLKW